MRPNQYDYPSIRTALHPANCKRYSEGNGVFDLYGLVAEYTTPSLSRKLATATLRAWGATTLLVVRATTRGAMTTTQEAVSRGNRQAMLHALQDEEGPGWSISGKIARGLASYCLFDGEESGTQAPYAKSTDTYGWDVATDPAMLRTCRDKRRHLIARYVERKLHRWASSRSYLRRLEQLPLPPAHNVNSHAGNEAAGSASGTAFRTASGAASTSPLQPFDVFCKVLHMECLGPSWVVLVWDGTDAPLVQPDSWRRLTCGRQQPPQGGQRQQQLLLQPQGQQGQPVVSDAAPTPLEDALMRLKEDTALFRTFPATGSIIPLLIDSTCDLAAPSTRQPQGSTARPILGLQPGEWAYMRNVSCTLWCGAELILALDSKQGPLPSSGTGAGPRTAMPAGWPDRNVGGSSSALQGNHPHQSDTGSGGGAGVAMRGPRPLQGVVQVFTAAAGALGEERARESERAAAGVAAVTFVRGRPMVPSACYATCAAQLMSQGGPPFSRTRVEHPGAPFSTIRAVLQHPSDVMKFRCLVQVVDFLPQDLTNFCVRAAPGNTEDAGGSMNMDTDVGALEVPAGSTTEGPFVFCHRLLLRDATGHLDLMLHGDAAAQFWGAGLNPSDLHHNHHQRSLLLRKLQELMEPCAHCVATHATGSCPYTWLDVCVLSYLPKSARERGFPMQRCYQVFDTMMLTQVLSPCCT
eukprot:jgi/Mesvir1/8793/Mv02699-RA.4